MSTTSALPTDFHGMPTGLLQAANKGDTTAMLALADFLRERDLPAQELEGEPMPSDQELAVGFLRLAHECERNTLQLQQLARLLSFLGRPPRQPFPRQHRVTASPAGAERIREYLRRVGVELTLYAGDYFRNVPPDRLDHGAYTIIFRWTGREETAVIRTLLGHLAAAFPRVRFVTPTYTGVLDPDVETALWCVQSSAHLTMSTPAQR